MLCLKYWKYDLHNATSQEYLALNEAFEAVGYSKAEESGQISNEKKTTHDAEKDLEEVCLRTDKFFPQKLGELSLTDALSYTDVTELTKKFCNNINAHYKKTKVNDYRYITFDLTEENLARKKGAKYKDIVGFSKAFEEKGWSDSYAEQYARAQLAKSLEKHGFVRTQNSAYVSKKKMTEDELMKAYKEICHENPKLYMYAENIHMSVRGLNLDRDMVNFVKSYEPSKEIKNELENIREDLFLTLDVEKNHVYCYSHDKENNKYYKYKLTDKPYDLSGNAYFAIQSLSVDIMKSNYDKFRSKSYVKEIFQEDYDRVNKKTSNGFRAILDEDNSYDMSFTKENLSKLITVLQEPEKEMKKERSEAIKELRESIKKEYNLSFIETPKITKYHTNDKERMDFFDDISKASSEEVLDKTKNFIGTCLEKDQKYYNIPIDFNIAMPSDCNSLKYFERDSSVAARLWTEAYDKEIASNNKGASGLVASIIELDIPKELDLRQSQKVLEKFTKEIFAKNGHVSQYFLQCDKDNPTKLKGTVIVANRRMQKDRWIEKKGIEMEGKDKKETINLLYGVDSRDAGERLRNAWLETIEDVMKEKNNAKGKVIYKSGRILNDFAVYVDKKKSEKGKVFDKRKVSVKEFIRDSWKQRMNKFNRSLRNPELER